MPLDTIASPDVKTTAGNIVKNATDKAAGKGAPTNKIPPQKPDDGDEKGKPVTAVDPNAGKKKYTVEGKEYWMTPEQADVYVQKGIAFEPRISDIARMKQEMVNFEQALIENPGAIIANIAKRRNVPVQQLVENVLSSNASDEVKEATGKWYWENVAKRHQMDPKDRAILERDEQIAKFKEVQDAQAKSAVALENKQRVDAMMGQVKGQIKEAMTEFGLPNIDTPIGAQMAKRVADVMRLSYINRKPITPKEAAGLVREEVRQYQRSFYDALDEDKIVEELGKDNAEKVRKYFLKVMKAVEKEQPKTGDAPPSKRGERKVITPDEMKDYLENLKRNGK